jgi:hypothetical protein
LATTLASIVDLIHPTASGIGVPTNDQIWVLFDRAIDETTIAGGNFFVTGPDFDTWSGPDLQLFHDRESVGDEEYPLESPGYHGLVQGTFSYERISLSDLSVVSGIDTVGSGALYRTKAIFTPTNQLQANTEYTVYLSGDEDTTDSFSTGIASRSVFDTVTSGTNLGTGLATFTGGYEGLALVDALRVEVTTSGDVGVAKFTFVRDSDPLSVFGPFLTRQAGVYLGDGVSVEFDEGTYEAGDQWSVVVKEREVFTGSSYWPFKTGAGVFEPLPTTTATSVTGDPAPTPTTGTTPATTFSVSSTTPTDGATHQTLTDYTLPISVTFSSEIDDTTVQSGVSVSVVTEAVLGEPDVTASGILAADPQVSGSTLNVVVAEDQVFQNNLVTVTVDSTVTGANGVALGSDYSFSFTTTYTPYYCTERRLRVMIGSYIADIDPDTVNAAIYIASVEAGHLTWNKDNITDEYYKFARSQWVCCRAASILLSNASALKGAVRSKRLGDLTVEYDTTSGGVDVSAPLRKTEECMARWEGVIQAGGRQVMAPKAVIKGDAEIERFAFGRGWTQAVNPNHPAANTKVRYQNGRRWRKAWWR